MTAEKLTQRLHDSASELRQIGNSRGLITSISLHLDCISELEKFDEIANNLTATCDLVAVREDARHLLHNLPLIANSSTNLVDYHGTKIPFSNARLLGFQGYLSMTWAICDSITTAISPLICTGTTCKDRTNPPQLLTHFLKSTKDSTYYSAYFLKLNYGWPIGVSYVIRNHFFHDGALWQGEDFFAGKRVEDKFEISQKGWTFLLDQMQKKHNLEINQHRLSDSWPWHQDNLLKLLELCNDEIDEALSCLVGWSVGMATLQARYLLERDFSAEPPPPTSL